MVRELAYHKLNHHGEILSDEFLKPIPTIAITMGDPAGIGPEIISKLFWDAKVYTMCNPVVFGDFYVMQRALSDFNIPLQINKIGKLEEATFQRGQIDLLNLSNIKEETFHYGSFIPGTAQPIIDYIEKAAIYALEGKIDAMVTCPINKHGLIISGFKFPGHTEFLAYLSKSKKYAMMMVGDHLCVTLVTTHCPLSKVAQLLTKENILATIELTYDTLKRSTPQDREPNLVVAGLNPHAGEDGMMGKEEEEIIRPAVEEARKMGINVVGPKPADTLFHFASSGIYDAVVCMYHDQGLIPIKLLDFYTAVNVTLGLSFIRTSVDHGVAYDIAGKGIADFRSLKKAIEVAVKFSGKKREIGN